MHNQSTLTQNVLKLSYVKVIRVYNNGIKTKGDKMKEFSFLVEFEDGNCDIRKSKANTEDEAKETLIKHLDFLHKKPLFKGKKYLEVKGM